MTHVLERHRRASEARVLAAGRTFEAVAAAQAVSAEYRVVWRDGADEGAVLRARHCDLAVCAKPTPAELPQAWSGEHILLASGVPVLLVPDDWREGGIGEHVLVGWNGSRESRRAVADAMPMLAKAAEVTIVAIDRADGRSDPGEDLVLHLERHGVKASVTSVKRSDRSTSEVLMQQVVEAQADCLVIGAYSRPRTTERLFGGTTRNLLARCPAPLFLSR